MTPTTWFLLYIVLINILAFILFGIDKYKAAKGRWRISEKTLFLAAIFGGSFGARMAMEIFRHKTKKRSFVLGIPLILILQCIAIFGFYLFVGRG